MPSNTSTQPDAARDAARVALVITANDLRRCLRRLNEYGDTLSPRLAVQADGFVYGEIFDGFKILMDVLFPDDGVKERAGQIIDAMFDSEFTVEEAASYVIEKNAPKAYYSTDEVRDDLVRYRAYLIALNDGVLKADRLVSTDDPDEARKWLTDEIDECLAALAHRNEPEVKPNH